MVFWRRIEGRLRSEPKRLLATQMTRIPRLIYNFGFPLRSDGRSLITVARKISLRYLEGYDGASFREVEHDERKRCTTDSLEPLTFQASQLHGQVVTSGKEEM